MNLREELTRQSLLLEFISECVSLQSVEDLAKLITARLHWICDYDTCSTLLPDAHGLSLRLHDRKAGAAVPTDDVFLKTHKAALHDAMARGSPVLTHHNDGVSFLAALPLGSRTSVYGALCVAKLANGFSQTDIRHLQQACSAVGSALARIAAVAAEHEAEAALRENETRYRTLFNSIDVGFCVIEFIDGPHGPMSDYVHLEANPAYVRHAGIPDIVGKTGRENLTESEANAWVEIFRRVLDTGEPVRFERALESTHRYLEVACSRIAPAFKRQVAIVFQDITPHYRAERALQELNENLEGIVAERTRERDRMWDTTQDLMLLIDFAGVFRRVNPAWTVVLGYDEKELVGHHINEFVIPDFHQANVNAYNKASRGEQLSMVNCYRHKDGSPRWIAWTAAPDEHVIYANGRDITAEREQAVALANAEEALRQSQKMEAVGQLTGGLAHDFNNLLASISGGLQVLKLKLQRGQFSGLERYVDIGESSVRRAAALTQRLLAFSRRQTLDPKPTDVSRLIAGMDDLVRRSVGPTVDVQVIDAPDLWPTRIDASQLENALLNLCINARDAMLPAGGKLTLTTANRSIDEYHREPNMAPGEYVVLSVSDTGSGMPPEVIERIFDPFYTTKPLGEGTGLGLSMVYGFVHQSGGQVRVSSEVGIGTTMSLYLPRYVGTVAAEDSIASAPFESGHGETVLIIEDEPVLRELIEEVLRDAGYRVFTAQDGPTGLQVLRSNTHIDLLITDVGLPGGLNGRQVADAARIWRQNLKVLFITGYADAATIGDGGLAPGMEVMTKPFDISIFANRIGSLVTSTNT